MVQHPDPDDLPLLAMGEAIDLAFDAHLAECGQCRAEVESMRRTVELAELSNYGGGHPPNGGAHLERHRRRTRIRRDPDHERFGHPTQAGTATEWNPHHGSHGLAFWQKNTGIPSAPEI